MDFTQKRDEYMSLFSTGFFGDNLEDRFMLISLICNLKNKIIEKRPNITFLDIIKMINKNKYIEQNFEENLAIICEDFAYGCKYFPTFGFEVKDMPKEVERILSSFLPF